MEAAARSRGLPKITWHFGNALVYCHVFKFNELAVFDLVN